MDRRVTTTNSKQRARERERKRTTGLSPEDLNQTNQEFTSASSPSYRLTWIYMYPTTDYPSPGQRRRLLCSALMPCLGLVPCHLAELQNTACESHRPSMAGVLVRKGLGARYSFSHQEPPLRIRVDEDSKSHAAVGGGSDSSPLGRKAAGGGNAVHGPWHGFACLDAPVETPDRANGRVSEQDLLAMLY